MVIFGAVLCAQPTPGKPGQVEGIVTNSVTGDPVRKATVVLQGGNSQREADTDAAGHFHFDNVTPGTYQAAANRDGFMQVPDQTAWSKPFTVAEEQQVKDVVMKLLPLAVVNGHVFDEDDDPMINASIQALRYVYRRGEKQLTPAGFASTNDLGEYQMLDLEPGRYYFLVTTLQRMGNIAIRTPSGTPEMAYPPTYYPNVTQSAQATATQVGPGAQLTNLDFHPHKVRAFHVRGKAIDGETGQPVANVMLRLVPREARSFRAFNFIRVRKDGTFETRGVVSGSYIAAGDESGGDAAKSVREVVNVGDQDVDGVVLTFRKPFVISGKFVWEGSPPRQTGRIRVGLDQIDGDWSVRAMVDDQGTFTLQVTPGVYRVNIYIVAGSYVRSIRFGDQDASSGRIDVTQGAGAALNIVLSTDVGELQGSVQTEDGEPAAGAMITVVPRDELEDRSDLFYEIFSDPNGNFDYKDLAPGEYKVFASDVMDQDVLQSPEFRKALEGKLTAVNIQPGGHASVPLKLIPAAVIEAEKNKLP